MAEQQRQAQVVLSGLDNMVAEAAARGAPVAIVQDATHIDHLVLSDKDLYEEQSETDLQ